MDDLSPSRRGFLAGTAAILGATALGRDALAAPPSMGRGRVVLVEHPGATLDKSKVDEAVVGRMVEEALKLFTGAPSGKDALAKLFKPGQKVAIKVNALGNPFAAVSPAVAMALAKHLAEAGIKKPDIRIFDQYVGRMQKAGYKMQKPADGVWVTGHEGSDPTAQTYTDGSSTVKFHWAQSMVWADAVIDLCFPKDHNLTGITGALKNMSLGVVRPTPEAEKQPNGYTVVPRFHRNNCDPAIAKLYALPMIKDKVKLIVCDATRLLYHGGPQDNPRYRVQNNQILVSTDPVAMDTTILDLVNGWRAKNGLAKVEDDTQRQPRPPKFLKTAADMGLGEGDRSKIKLEKKVLS